MPPCVKDERIPEQDKCLYTTITTTTDVVACVRRERERELDLAGYIYIFMRDDQSSDKRRRREKGRRKLPPPEIKQDFPISSRPSADDDNLLLHKPPSYFWKAITAGPSRSHGTLGKREREKDTDGFSPDNLS